MCRSCGCSGGGGSGGLGIGYEGSTYSRDGSAYRTCIRLNRCFIFGDGVCGYCGGDGIMSNRGELCNSVIRTRSKGAIFGGSVPASVSSRLTVSSDRTVLCIEMLSSSVMGMSNSERTCLLSGGFGVVCYRCGVNGFP